MGSGEEECFAAAEIENHIEQNMVCPVYNKTCKQIIRNEPMEYGLCNSSHNIHRINIISQWSSRVSTVKNVLAPLPPVDEFKNLSKGILPME